MREPTRASLLFTIRVAMSVATDAVFVRKPTALAEVKSILSRPSRRAAAPQTQRRTVVWHHISNDFKRRLGAECRSPRLGVINV